MGSLFFPPTLILHSNATLVPAALHLLPPDMLGLLLTGSGDPSATQTGPRPSDVEAKLTVLGILTGTHAERQKTSRNRRNEIAVQVAARRKALPHEVESVLPPVVAWGQRWHMLVVQHQQQIRKERRLRCKVPSRTCRHEIVEIVMPTACGSLDVTTESEPPFLEQDGLKLNRNIVRKDVRKEFSGEMAGNWRTLEIDNEEEG